MNPSLIRGRDIYARLRQRNTRNNEHNEGEIMGDPIPLSHLLLEGLGDSIGGPSIDTLEQQIVAAGHPVIVDYIGRRAVTRDVARQLIAARDAEQAAQREREQEWRRELAHSNTPQQQRIRAIAERQRRMRADGTIDNSTPAFAAMTIDDPNANTRLTAAGERFDELLAAERRGDYGTFHRITPPKET
jgi:cell division protein FtsL